MITIVIPGEEFFNEETGLFESSPGIKYTMEHSLASLSKWESIWQIPFLSEKPKTAEQNFSYFECMVLDESLDTEPLRRISEEDLQRLESYIVTPKTATTFSNTPDARASREVITSEVIYYWMTQFSIWLGCDTWHLNRLLTLIRVTNAKNAPEKKRGRGELAAQRAQLNAERRRALGTSG
jgi:hypothetical protein